MKPTAQKRYADLRSWFNETEIKGIRREPIQIDQWFQGRYEVFAVLGYGHTSVVFKAMDTKLQRVVAVKVWHNAGYGINDTVLLKEGRLLASIQHPNIVKVYDFGTDNLDGRPWTILEYLGVATLYDVLHYKGCLAGQWQLLAHIVAQVASIVDFLHHSVKVFQLDLKPGNLSFNAESTAITLMDLGSAYHVASQHIWRYGTPGYIAPESFQDTPVNDKCDLFSLGILLYELITGQNPLAEMQRTALEVADPTEPAASVHILSESSLPEKVELTPSSMNWPPYEVEPAIDLQILNEAPKVLRDDGWDGSTAAIPIGDQSQGRYSRLLKAMRKMDLRQRLYELGTPAILREVAEALTSFECNARPSAHEVRMALQPMAEGTDVANMPTLFLSHSKKDKSRFVRKFATALRGKGFHVWMDEDSLRTGEPFWESITQAIQTSNFVIVILSENSVGSAGVTEEIRAAHLQNLTSTKLLPIRIDPIEFGSIPKALLSRHVLDFVGWQEDDVFRRQLDKLCADIMAMRADKMKLDEQTNHN